MDWKTHYELGPYIVFTDRCIWQIRRYYRKRATQLLLLCFTGRSPSPTQTVSHHRLKRASILHLWICELSPKTPTNREVRGQVKNLESPRLFSLLRLWVAWVLQSTISAWVSSLLPQRKGIQKTWRPRPVPCGQRDGKRFSRRTMTRVSWPPHNAPRLHTAAMTRKNVFISSCRAAQLAVYPTLNIIPYINFSSWFVLFCAKWLILHHSFSS